MFFSSARLVLAAIATSTFYHGIPSALGQTLGEPGSITVGIKLMTNVTTELYRDSFEKKLEDIMKDESCESLELGKEYYNGEGAVYFDSIPHYTDNNSVEYDLYLDYYGPNFLRKWVNAAFAGGKTNLRKNRFSANYAKLPGNLETGKDKASGECVGREEGVKKGIAYTSTYIDLNQYFQQALDLLEGEDGCVWGRQLFIDCVGEKDPVCQENPSPCEDAVNAWEKAIATWGGSIEKGYGRNRKEPGENGKWLFALANKRCANFKTCGTSDADATFKGATARANMRIQSLFSKGRDAVFNGDKAKVEKTISEINKELTIIRIQGTLRYSYRMGEKKSTRDKEIAEGATFAYGAIPQVYACNPKSAAILKDNLEIGGAATTGGNVNFKNVLLAFECNYGCLGITYDDIGELNECKNKEDEVDICFEKKKTPTDICKFKLDKVSTNKCKKIAPKKKKNKQWFATRFGKITLTPF